MPFRHWSTRFSSLDPQQRITYSPNYHAEYDKAKLNKLGLSAKIGDLKNETFKTFMQSLDSTDKSDYSLWKATRRIKRPYSQIQPIRKEDRTWAKTEEEMAATFGRHLQRTFQPNDIESSLPPSEPDLNV